MNQKPEEIYWIMLATSLPICQVEEVLGLCLQLKVQSRICLIGLSSFHSKIGSQRYLTYPLLQICLLDDLVVSWLMGKKKSPVVLLLNVELHLLSVHLGQLFENVLLLFLRYREFISWVLRTYSNFFRRVQLMYACLLLSIH